jgi:hypothetical protein
MNLEFSRNATLPSVFRRSADLCGWDFRKDSAYEEAERHAYDTGGFIASLCLPHSRARQDGARDNLLSA